MTKFTIILAALLSVAAHAEVVATMPNQAGGEIKLTDQRGNCNEATFAAYSTHPRGDVLTACWFIIDDDVFVNFDNGRTKAFKSHDFTMKGKLARKQGAML